MSQNPSGNYRVTSLNVNEFTVTSETAGAVLAALRRHQPGLSWSEARRFLADRRISINGILCVDEGRRVVPADILQLRTKSLPAPPRDDNVRILHLDDFLVVVDKPPGMLALRHPGDTGWRQQRKDLAPSLEECLQRLIQRRRDATAGRRRSEGERRHGNTSREITLLPVHRIDRETSGILVFALREDAQEKLIAQFASHTTLRRYFCIVPGKVEAQTIRNRLIRDRGDGLRGICPDNTHGKRAVTHLTPIRSIRDYTELECRLETGRTNQIRIHLAEMNHPICGDVKYRGKFGAPPVPDTSGAPRLALHAAELGFIHPDTGKEMRFEVSWPSDLLRFRKTLESSESRSESARTATSKHRSDKRRGGTVG